MDGSRRWPSREEKHRRDLLTCVIWKLAASVHGTTVTIDNIINFVVNKKEINNQLPYMMVTIDIGTNQPTSGV